MSSFQDMMALFEPVIKSSLKNYPNTLNGAHFMPPTNCLKYIFNQSIDDNNCSPCIIGKLQESLSKNIENAAVSIGLHATIDISHSCLYIFIR